MIEIERCAIPSGATLPQGERRIYKRRKVIVAVHGSKPIPIGTFKSIIEGSGLGVDDFR